MKSMKSVGQEEKARYEEAEKREEGFSFQTVGMGNELKGERGNQGKENMQCVEGMLRSPACLKEKGQRCV